MMFLHYTFHSEEADDRQVGVELEGEMKWLANGGCRWLRNIET